MQCIGSNPTGGEKAITCRIGEVVE
jgi:hypothetical protein